MCIYCSNETTVMPPTMALRADGSDFYCMYCQQDTSCPTPPMFDIGEEVMHQDEGTAVIVDGSTDGFRYDIVPLVDGEWSTYAHSIAVNACELERV